MSHIDQGTLHAYLDGELGERRRTEIEEHLSVCDECRNRLQQAERLSRRASDLLAELEPAAAAAPAWREIEERAAARQRQKARRPVVRPSLAWAASIALAFAIGWAARAYWFAPRLPFESVAPLEAERRVAAVPEEAADAAPGAAPVAAPPLEVDPLADRFEEMETRARPSRGKSDPEPQVTAPAAGGVEIAAQPPAGAEQGRRDEAATRERIVADEPQAAAPEADRALVPSALEEAPQMERALQRAVTPELPEGESAGFVAVQLEEAEVWLGAPLRRLPDLELQRVEVGPGGTLEGGLAGLPAVRLVYADAAGHEIALIQQSTGGPTVYTEAPKSALLVEPSGVTSYRWMDDDGYLLILKGAVSSDSLRALADRVR
jgi:hypothetical protein